MVTRPAALLAAVVAPLVLAAGCGTDDGGDMSGEPSGPATRAGTTELIIVVRSGRGSEERRFSLVCDPAGGDHPDPEAACRLLDELDDPFAPVPPDTMCTEIYGGPQTATVTGTLRGEPVDAELDRTNGCEISRWDQHAVILGETRSGAGGPS